MSRLLLQVCTGLLALIPIATGVAVFLGGVGRVLSWAQIGPPPKPYVGFIILELLSAPLFIYWQYRLTQSVATP